MCSKFRKPARTSSRFLQYVANLPLVTLHNFLHFYLKYLYIFSLAFLSVLLYIVLNR